MSTYKECMKRIMIILLIAFLLLGGVQASDLEVKKVDKGSVVIAELNNPAVFEFVIKNNGPKDMFHIYSLISVTMTPKENFEIDAGEEKTITVRAYPDSEIRKQRGLFNFEYQIKGMNSGIFKDNLGLTILELKDSFEIVSKEVNFGDKFMVANIKNTQNTNLENMRLNFVSDFFDENKVITLSPFEEKEVIVELNSDRMKKLLAGNYVYRVEAEISNAKTDLSGVVNYVKKEDVSYEERKSGFFIRKITVERKNNGNVPVKAEVQISENFIQRFFSVHSAEPTLKESSLFKSNYIWEKEVSPGEAIIIYSKINYTIPFIVLLLIGGIIAGFVIYMRTELVLKKKVHFVKTKGGEFALKVVLTAKARKHVEDIQIVDKLPGMTKLYEKFGIKPDKIDHATRRIFWNINNLNEGEERVYSYIIYSKIKVVGKFELSPAMAMYERDGKTHEVLSNRAFFDSENLK